MTFPKLEQLLFGHTSEETAYVVNDYPYGFTLRCKIRYWIETHPKHGDRFCSQTTNPKKIGDPWNKPKKSTYDPIMLMLKDEETGHIKYRVFRFNGEQSAELKINFLATIEDKLNKGQIDSVRMWYISHISVGYLYSIRSEYKEETHPLVRTWTKEVAKHAAKASLSELFNHPKAPVRDGDKSKLNEWELKEWDYYIGNGEHFTQEQTETATA